MSPILVCSKSCKNSAAYIFTLQHSSLVRVCIALTLIEPTVLDQNLPLIAVFFIYFKVARCTYYMVLSWQSSDILYMRSYRDTNVQWMEIDGNIRKVIAGANSVRPNTLMYCIYI